MGIEASKCLGIYKTITNADRPLVYDQLIARTRRGMGVHPAVDWSMPFRLVPSLAVLFMLRVGILEVPLKPGAGSDELGDLGTSLRRAFGGVEGSSAAVEALAGLLIRPLPVFTGVPETPVESPRRRIRRDRGVAANAVVRVVEPLSDSTLAASWLALCTWPRLLRPLADGFFSERSAFPMSL